MSRPYVITCDCDPNNDAPFMLDGFVTHKPFGLAEIEELMTVLREARDSREAYLEWLQRQPRAMVA